MKKLQFLIISCMLILAAVLLLVYPEVCAQAIQNGLSICAKSVLPSLFPFFVISNLFVAAGFSHKLSKAAAPLLHRVFHLPHACASALILGYIGGYPVGAASIARLYEAKEISKTDAEYSMLFCNNAGPAFIFGILGGSIFHSLKLAVILWLIHVCSSLFLGILFRPNLTPESTQISLQEKEEIPISTALTQSVSNAAEATLRVSACILLFSIICEYAHHLKFGENSLFTYLLASLELTNGIHLLHETGISQQQLFVFTSGLLGWGGLCVHCQTLDVLSRAELRSNHYFVGKILHAMLSVCFACMISLFLDFNLSDLYVIPGSKWLSLIPLMLCFAALFFLKTTSGKQVQNQL